MFNEYEDVVGESFRLQKVISLDTPQDCHQLGSLAQTLEDCLEDEPLRNLLVVPLQSAEEKSEGALVLVNRDDGHISSLGMNRVHSILLRTLGSSLLLVRRNIELSQSLQAFTGAIVEQQKVTTLADASKKLAHDIKNPINNILSCVSVLRETSIPQEEKVGTLSEIERGCDSINRTTSELVDFVKNAWAPESVDLSLVVEKAISSVLSDVKEKDLKLEGKLPRPIVVKGKESQYVGVLSNVLRNAVDACEPGSGHIQIRLQDVRPEKVIIHVLDNGSGIDWEKRHEIFDLGYSTKRSTARIKRGLGLHLSKISLLHYGGNIWVESTKPGGGTEMAIRLPLWET